MGRPKKESKVTLPFLGDSTISSDLGKVYYRFHNFGIKATGKG